MTRIFAVLVIFFICVWLIPLGAFIKPDQEESACGGRRAVHMCAYSLVQEDTKETRPGITISNSSGSSQVSKAGASGGNDYAVSSDILFNLYKIRRFSVVEERSFTTPFIQTPDPIPKPIF